VGGRFVSTLDTDALGAKPFSEDVAPPPSFNRPEKGKFTMSGLNIEFHNFNIVQEENDGIRHRRTYRVKIGLGTGTLFLKTREDVSGGGQETFSGLYPNREAAVSGGEGIQMGGYVGAHKRGSILSVGTPWKAASLPLMRLAREAAESSNASLIVDEDNEDLLEGEERKRLHGVLRELLPTAGAPVVEKNGEMVPYFPTNRRENEKAKTVERLRLEKFQEAAVPTGSPAPGAPSWKKCFDRHFFEAMRDSRCRFQAAADAALKTWNGSRAVCSALLDDLWEDIDRKVKADERAVRTGKTSFRVVKTDGRGPEADIEKVLGKAEVREGRLHAGGNECSADWHGVQEAIRALQ
jgi:hypothetical protein